jgi:alkylation response protein AidB-like acyl-CoA dehydrogenase
MSTVLDLDEREEFPADACKELHAQGYFEHFIPKELGGKLTRLDELVTAGRPVAARDLTLAIATGQTLLGALPIWLDGNAEQRARVAEIIRGGGLGCLALTEEAHGSDIANSEVTMTSTLTGEKWCINNATRGAFMTVLARTDQEGHAIAFVDKEKAKSSLTNIPRLRTHGIRGADISGIRFQGTPATIVGRANGGLSLVFRTLQISRTACAAFSLGAGEAALRLAYSFASKRRLYGKTAFDIPVVRHALANAYADFLAADALTLVACRSASLVPEEMSVTSAIVKAIVPALIDDILREVGVVLGARGYLREGDGTAMFQKIVRDHAVVGLFDGSTAVNLAVLANQLPKLADARSDAKIRSELFDRSELPDLPWSKLRPTARGSDSIVSSLKGTSLATHLHEFDHLLRTVADDGPKAFELARHYCLLAAAASVIGLKIKMSDAVLARILERLGTPTTKTDTAVLADALADF